MNRPNYIPKNFPIEKPKSNMLKTFGEKIQTPSFWFAFQKIGKSYYVHINCEITSISHLIAYYKYISNQTKLYLYPLGAKFTRPCLP
jgi:hypothetical protein